MAHLIYYKNERDEFQEEFKKTLSSTDAVIIVIRKLIKHYKLGNPNINITSGRNHSNASRWHITINNQQFNFGVICHEVAHTYQAKKYAGQKIRWHTKKHRMIMKRMLHYCERKNWFEEELNRRLTPKPMKPEPTKEDLKRKKLELLEANLKRYTTKVKMYQNKIKKANKRITSLKKFLN